jgi:hypothetical protein
VLIRRVWPGEAKAERHEEQLRLYRSYAPTSATGHWSEDPPVSGDATAITEGLVAQAGVVGADCLNLRVHSPDVTPSDARRQIGALSAVVEALATGWRDG